MKSFDVNELDALLLDFHDQGLSDEQHEALQTLLRENPEARREFARLQLMDAAMHLMAGEEDAMTSLDVPRPRLLSIKFVALSAIAACVVFGFGMLCERLLLPHAATEVAVAQPILVEPSDDALELFDRGVAILAEAVGVRWDGDVQPAVGGSVNRGYLKFSEGVIQLEFYRGARLIVAGPASLELVSANKVICHEGELRAFVPPQARGFTVISPTTELVDLGTEFAMKVGVSGKSEVHVFDGLVELYPPGGKRLVAERKELVAGSAVSMERGGEMVAIEPNPAAYPTFIQVRELAREAANRRLQAWRMTSHHTTDDPRSLVHYDFEGNGRWLRGNKSVHSEYRGAVIGCDRVDGRWPGKGALEFKRAGDRVRIEVLGSFDALTLTAWVRVDAIKKTYQGLLLTDGFEVGGFHWQISNEGDLRFGVRLPTDGQDEEVRVADYSAARVFTSERLGTWIHLCTVYDRNSGQVLHFVDGKQIRQHDIETNIPLTIGTAEIGNWGAPLSLELNPVRNFNGRIDEMTIWSGALPVSEIQKAYKQGRP